METPGFDGRRSRGVQGAPATFVLGPLVVSCAILAAVAAACDSPVYTRTSVIAGMVGSGGRGPIGLPNTGGAPRSPDGRASGGAGNGTPAGTGGAGTGGVVCDPGIGGAAAPGANGGAPGAQYDFEATAQDWAAGVGSSAFASVARSTDRFFDGAAALAGSIDAAGAGLYVLEVDPAVPPIAAGTTITFHVWVPAGGAVTWVQPYVQDQAFAFTGVYAPLACTAAGDWTAVRLTVPADAAAPVGRLGVQIYVSTIWTGVIYVDAVTW